jgi:hypothetical protein
MALVAAGAFAADLQTGTVELKSAGPLTFGPEGLLFVGDPIAATVYAIDTGDKTKLSAGGELNIEGLDTKVAERLGTDPKEVQINDMIVNPASGKVYLSVARGRGPSAQAVLLRIDPTGRIEEVPLQNVKFAKAALPDAPAAGATDKRGNNQRQESITDLVFVDGRLFIAGLSNEEFASKLRSIPYPFADSPKGTSVEIYHGAHGAFETRSPVRTFAAYTIDNQPHLLGAYTCTPLVKFPISQLKPGEKIRGTTIAELGNRNRPLDMFVYSKGGKDYILMANSSRGMMKITTEGANTTKSIESRVADKAGLTYETLAELKGVEQLDRLNDQSAVILARSDSGSLNLKTIPLP